MTESNIEGRIKSRTIEIEANKEIMDTHIYLDNERFQIKRKTNNVQKCLQFRHLTLFRADSIVNYTP